MSEKKRGALHKGQQYEEINSSQHILRALTDIKKQHKFIILQHKGYQSGSTALVEPRTDFLLIDRPLDWPGVSKKIRVLYRDNTNVWCYFNTTLLGSSQDTLKTSFPTELFRMQRRAHFRIAMSSQCKVSFKNHDIEFIEARINDLSVGGMSICLLGLNNVELLKQGDKVVDINIRIAPDGKAEQGGELEIKEGGIVRFFNTEDGRRCMGVEFYAQGREGNRLMQFVRSRELAALRKGVA
ncbi:flagellar brake protein [Desulfobacterota bacterium M19]